MRTNQVSLSPSHLRSWSGERETGRPIVGDLSRVPSSLFLSSARARGRSHWRDYGTKSAVSLGQRFSLADCVHTWTTLSLAASLAHHVEPSSITSCCLSGLVPLGSRPGPTRADQVSGLSPN